MKQLVACLLSVVGIVAWVDTLQGDDAAVERPVTFDLETGRHVYEQTCVRCHADRGTAAPQFGDVREWRQRLEQKGLPALIEHALKGHEGLRARMPPRGGDPNLSDAEVRSAVAYIVEAGNPLLDQAERISSNCAASIGDPAGACSREQARQYLLLQLLYLLSGER